MGCASSAQPQPVPSQQSNNNTARNAVQTAPAIGNSMPLQEPQRWSSKRKISRQQLEGKREEFWHTCQATNVPAVWQQIRTVCEVMASGDLATASAICQAANIITPEGSLTRCYDQFGNLYEIPHYCICDPINLVTGAPGSYTSAANTARSKEDVGPGCEIRVRLYVDEIELKIDTHENESITTLKTQIYEKTKEYTESKAANASHEDLPVEPERMRLFANGRELDDADTLSWAGVSPQHLVQVMVAYRK